ncbi:Alpha-D-kanosaminyltransferase [bacterium HR17]|uniref:Alpha-D-kanosaminyltransferase n=1 Tax=Candidatus Fervidibacter japonicus TaxID=2035412 RepID=A0A2H5X8T2_9BACT|nr:Alpha-D-kanosaminyltransferase [bacterium HR17]
MHLAMVTSWRVPCGIARYTEELVGALQQLPNCQVTVLPAGPQVWQADGRKVGWWWERSYWCEVARYANDADLVHVQFAPHFFGGFRPLRNLLPFFLSRLRRPTVVTVHEVDVTGHSFQGAFKRWMQRRWWRACLVRRLIATTHFVAEQLRRLGYEAVTVIPMWVPALPHRPSTQAAKERLGVTDKFVLVAFGFIGARRNYEMLLEALPQLPKDTLLVLAGGPHPLDRSGYYARLMQRLSEHPLRQRVFVTGYLPDEAVDEWLAAADVVLAPFQQLSGSASVMRALAHEKPIIASDLPPLRELAEASGALLLVPNDPTAWVAAIERLRTDAEEKRRLMDAARSFARRQTVVHVAQRHWLVYADILTEQGHRSRQ